MENQDNTVKAVIFERRPRLAIAISRVLEKSKLITVVGRADNPQRLLEIVQNLRPDVVVMDADRPGCSLQEFCTILKHDFQAGVVLMSTESRRGPVHEAFSAGADSI